MDRMTAPAGFVLGILRIVAALLFIEHGTQKLFGWPPAAQPMELAMFSLPWIAGVLEIVLGLLILIGLFSRAAAFLASGTMAVAYWYAHAPQNFFPVNNHGDAAILFCFVFLYIAAAGPGALSLDGRKRTTSSIT